MGYDLSLKSGDKVTVSVFCVPFNLKQASFLPPNLIRRQLADIFLSAMDNAIQLVGVEPYLWRLGALSGSQVGQKNFKLIRGSALSVADLINILGTILDKKCETGADTSVLILKADTVKGAVISRLISSKATTIWLSGNDISKLNRLAMHILYENGTSVKVIPDGRIGEIKVDMVISTHDSYLWELPNRFKRNKVIAAAESDLVDLSQEQTCSIVIGERVPMSAPTLFANQRLMNPVFAETMLLALESLEGKHSLTHSSQLTLEEVVYIQALTRKYGFHINDNAYSYGVVSQLS